MVGLCARLPETGRPCSIVTGAPGLSRERLLVQSAFLAEFEEIKSDLVKRKQWCQGVGISPCSCN